MNTTRLLIAASMLALLASWFALPLTASAASEQTAGGSGCAQFHVVVRGDHLARLALRFGTTVQALITLNGLANPNRILVGQTLCVRAGTPSGFTYTVRRGDTLTSIGRRFGWRAPFLASINRIRNPNRIFVGQRLFIPSH